MRIHAAANSITTKSYLRTAFKHGRSDTLVACRNPQQKKKRQECRFYKRQRTSATTAQTCRDFNAIEVRVSKAQATAALPPRLTTEATTGDRSLASLRSTNNQQQTTPNRYAQSI